MDEIGADTGPIDRSSRHSTGDSPRALRLLASLCDGDPVRQAEAEAVSVEAVRARIGLWDGVLAEFDNDR